MPQNESMTHNSYFQNLGKVILVEFPETQKSMTNQQILL